MFFTKEEQAKQLKQEIITNLAATVKELKALSAGIEKYFPQDLLTRSSPLLVPIWRLSEDLMKLDQLTEQLMHLIAAKSELLK